MIAIFISIQIFAKTWRRRLGECRMCSLGPSDRLVQQYCLERGTPLLPAVHPRHGAIRVEQDTKVPIHSRNGKYIFLRSHSPSQLLNRLIATQKLFPRFFSHGISHATSTSPIEGLTRRFVRHCYSHYGSRYKHWNLRRQKESK